MTAIPTPEKMTAEEYLRMTETMQEHTELIHGQVVAQAKPSRLHQHIGYRLFNAIDSFIRSNHGQCEVNGEIDVRIDDDNVVVPDVSVTCDPSKLDEHGCNGAPDWVVEILSSNRNDDLVYKLDLYLRSGVREYWIIDPKYQLITIMLMANMLGQDKTTDSVGKAIERYFTETIGEIGEYLGGGKQE